MDNNSNDKLFGFDFVNDMFSDNHSSTSNIDTQDDDLSDDELEELKKQSSKNRPATPGSKDNNPDDNDNDDKKDKDDDDKDIDDQKNQDDSKSKKTDASDDDENNKGDDGDSYDAEESAQVTALFDAIAEELEWEFSDDEQDEKPKTVEELVEYFKDVIEEQSVPQYANDEVKAIDEYVRNGGDLRKYFSITPDIDYDDFDTTKESNQKQIVKMVLTEKGYNEKQITRKIEKYEDAGILEDEAEDALEEMKEIEAAKKEKLLKDQEDLKKQRIEEQQKFINNVVNEINSMDNVRGIRIPEKDKKELLNYIFKADANGRTQYQKDYSKSVKNLIESAYFTMKGDLLIDTAKKLGTSSAIKNLKNSLRSTGVSKGTRKVNTTSSNSIFSRAVQLL